MTKGVIEIRMEAEGEVKIDQIEECPRRLHGSAELDV
jgi:hypothetical protein